MTVSKIGSQTLSGREKMSTRFMVNVPDGTRNPSLFLNRLLAEHQAFIDNHGFIYSSTNYQESNPIGTAEWIEDQEEDGSHWIIHCQSDAFMTSVLVHCGEFILLPDTPMPLQGATETRRTQEIPVTVDTIPLDGYPALFPDAMLPMFRDVHTGVVHNSPRADQGFEYNFFDDIDEISDNLSVADDPEDNTVSVRMM